MKYSIIGAGKTGRGFLARMLVEKGIEPVYIDRSKLLVAELAKNGSFQIHYFGGERPSISIPTTTVLHVSHPQAATEIAASDVVLVSVGASNLDEVGALIGTALKERTSASPLLVMTGENAIDPAQKLTAFIQKAVGDDMDINKKVVVTESAIFCSTIEDPSSTIDILSETYDQLPYDITGVPETITLPQFFIPESNFPLLLKRKIYTYNAASATIAYLGAYKGYEWYADAANDTEINAILDLFYAQVNDLLCSVFSIVPDNQYRFALASKTKFQNTNIRDSISRNARDVSRKLAIDERLIGPLLLAEEHNKPLNVMYLIIAAAIIYGLETEETAIVERFEAGGIAALLPIFADNAKVLEQIAHCFTELQRKSTGAFQCIH